MPGLFIDVQVDAKVASDKELAKKLSDVCAVDIFDQNPDGSLKVVEENLDECVLCDLCIQAVPACSVRVIKLYER